MYRIFINQSLLCVSDNESDQPEDAVPVTLPDNRAEHLLPVIERLEQEDGLHIFIRSASPDEFISQVIHKIFQPITAAGGLVYNPMGQILFIKRHGLWDLPKGKQDEEESDEETALREVREECGINELELKYKITSTFHAYTQKGKRIIKTTHWFAMYTDEVDTLEPQIEEDITELKWFSDDEVEIALENTYPSIREVTETALKMNEERPYNQTA